jgi:hypothetical protein
MACDRGLSAYFMIGHVVFTITAERLEINFFTGNCYHSRNLLNLAMVMPGIWRAVQNGPRGVFLKL